MSFHVSLAHNASTFAFMILIIFFGCVDKVLMVMVEVLEGAWVDEWRGDVVLVIFLAYV